MKQMVISSRRIAGMRGPLARHPHLTENLAHALYGLVGDALQAEIVKRFTIDPDQLETSLAQVLADVSAGTGHDPDEVTGPNGEHDRQDMEERLISKLQAADQLRPGYLLRALREGRKSLFERALAALGGFDADQIAKAIAANRPDVLALACAAVGIDRSVFPTILALVQTLNQGRPLAGGAAPERVAAAFSVSADEAARTFRSVAAGI